MKKCIILAYIIYFIFYISCENNTNTNTNTTTSKTGYDSVHLISSAIENGLLLTAFKCETKVNGVEKSIPLSWSNVPASAKSLAITMHHYPNPNDKTMINSYLLLWNIPTNITFITHGEALNGTWFVGPNKDKVGIGYTSPCSPSVGTAHEYILTIYALSETPSSLPKENSLNVTYQVLTEAIKTVTILGKGTLTFLDKN